MSEQGRAGVLSGPARQAPSPPARRGPSTAAARTHTPKSRKTRAAILAAARHLFAGRGFEQVSLREIGAEAGADPALVARYFGSKEKLFAEALATAQGSDGFPPGDSAGFASRVARAAVLGEWQSSGLEGLLIALRSAFSPEVSDSLIRPFAQRFIQHLAEQFGGEERMERAHLAFASIAGAALLHGMRSPGEMACSAFQAETIADRFTRDLREMMNRAG